MGGGFLIKKISGGQESTRRYKKMEKENFFENKIKNDPEEEQMYRIPEDEFEFSFSRSSGKGGQNVNKVSTKVRAKWNVLKSEGFTEEEKDKILEKLEGTDYMDSKGNLIVYSQSERSQAQNKKDAIEKANRLIAAPLAPKKERIPTRPGRAYHEKRLKEKEITSRKKELRKPPRLEE